MFLTKENLPELPVARLHMASGHVIEGYKNQTVLGRFNGGLFVVKHGFDNEIEAFVPVLYDTRNDAERAARELLEEGEHWTVFPVDAAFGYISEQAPYVA